MRKIKLVVLVLVAFGMVISCKKKKEPKQEQEVSVEKEFEKALGDDSKSETKSSVVYSKKHQADDLSVIVDAKNGEVSKVSVSLESLEGNSKEEIDVEGQVVDSYLTDLNKDGLREIILVVNPTDDSGNVDLQGMVISKKGNSFMDLYVDEVQGKRDVNTDKVIVENNTITREYKVDGKLVKYTYGVSEGKTGYVLKPTKQ